MKKWWLRVFAVILIISIGYTQGYAQCSICTKTASQMGKESAQGLNAGIIYLMFAPLAILGFIGYRWWRQEKMLSAKS